MLPWLSRLRHDLLKYALWRARDLRDLGRPARPEELRALGRGLLDLRDGEGRSVTALGLWRGLLAEAPPEIACQHAALGAFEEAVRRAEGAARGLAEGSQDPAAVLDAALALAGAFAELARQLEGPGE